MRRCVISMVVCAALALLAVDPLPASAVASPSPDAVTFQANIAHDGHVVDPAITLPLSQKWSVPLTTPSFPIIAQGLVIVTSDDSTTSGGSRLTARDAATGTEVWGHNISGTYGWSAAGYDNGTVFVVNFDGLLRSYDAVTGAFGWSVQLPDQYIFTSPPTATDGVVYVSGAGVGGTVYAVDETNGDLLWSQGVENGDHSSPTIAGGSLFVAYSCPQAYAFNRTDGTPLWHYSGGCEGGGGKTVVYHEGRVYVRDVYFGSHNGLVLSANDGRTKGAFSATAIPAFAGDTGFFLNKGTLRGVTVSDLSTQWSWAGDGDLSSAPLVVNGWVFVGSSSGTIYARRKTTGKGAWRANVGAEIPSPDEHNADQLTGLGAGNGILVVPAVDRLVAYGSS
jgi:outer membrane protein assembly factor BamB